MKGIHEKKILRLRRRQIYPRGRPMDPAFLIDRNPIMDRTTPIGSIGSCFAGALKNHLIREGFNYIQTSRAKGSEIGSAAWGVVYNTFCIRQEMARAEGDFSPLETIWRDGDGGYLDPYRKGVGWPTQVEAQKERAAHAEAARQALEKIKILVVTVGLTEIWFNRDDGAVFFQVPPINVYNPAAHAFRVSSVEENAENLRVAFETLWRINPSCEVVLTVSPVPLRATFRPLNVITANAQSKATLVLTAHQMAEAFERVHYFPSYELVTVLARTPYRVDNRHVRPKVVQAIMRTFAGSFVR